MSPRGDESRPQGGNIYASAILSGLVGAVAGIAATAYLMWRFGPVAAGDRQHDRDRARRREHASHVLRLLRFEVFRAGIANEHNGKLGPNPAVGAPVPLPLGSVLGLARDLASVGELDDDFGRALSAYIAAAEVHSERVATWRASMTSTDTGQAREPGVSAYKRIIDDAGKTRQDIDGLLAQLDESLTSWE